MIIAQYQINVESNTAGQPIPSGGNFVVEQMFLYDEKWVLIPCMYLNNELSVCCHDFGDFTKEELSPNFVKDTTPEVFINNVMKPLLDAKYGAKNWEKIV